MAHTPIAPSEQPDTRDGRARVFASTLGLWLLVVAAAAVSLRVADTIPRAVIGVPRGVRSVATVADLDRLTGRPMPLPAYYPDTMAWPPARALYHVGGSAAIWCRLRTARATALIVATAPADSAGVAADVLPRSEELQREDVALGGRPATVARVRDEDGTVWQQVQWRTPRQIILVRYRGTLEELLSVAGSVH